jgi:hypothetical protein
VTNRHKLAYGTNLLQSGETLRASAKAAGCTEAEFREHLVQAGLRKPIQRRPKRDLSQFCELIRRERK